MLIHRFICQKDAKQGFEDIGRYIINFLKFMKEKNPQQHLKYMPIKAAFPIKSNFEIDARIISFYDKKLGNCIYVHEILNDTSPIGFRNFTFQTQISNIKTEIDKDLTSVPKEEPTNTTETLVPTPATRRYRQNTISTNRKKRCGSLSNVNLEIEEITDDEIKTKILKVYQTEDSETPTDQSLTESSEDNGGKPRKTIISSQGEDFITPKFPTEYTHNFDEFNQYMSHIKKFEHIQNLQVNAGQKLDIVIDSETEKPNKKSIIEGRNRQYITATFKYQNIYVGLLELENTGSTSTWVISSQKPIIQETFDRFLNLYIKKNQHINDIKADHKSNKTISFKTKNHERNSKITDSDKDRWMVGMLSKIKI